MSEHPKLHLILSVLALFLGFILLIWTLSEPITEAHRAKVIIEVLAHMITFYLSVDVIIRYHNNIPKPKKE